MTVCVATGKYELIYPFSEDQEELNLLTIQGSEAKSFYLGQPPSYAHDGNYDTIYGVKDRDTAGNYLKLYLDELFSISYVNVTNRLDGFFDRFGGTKVIVIRSNEDKQTEQNCGTVSGKNFFYAYAISIDRHL